jgi:uncharacterized RDD family membrane protein YckC
MTCRNRRDSYQEVNGPQGSDGSVPAANLHLSQRRFQPPNSLLIAVSLERQTMRDRPVLLLGPHILFIRLEACQKYHPLRLNDFTEASLGLSTMSSAQLDILPPDEAPSQMEAAAPFALKEQVAERLAAHRARHTRGSGAPTPIAPTTPAKSRSARIAAAVAERYAHSQSYRAFLAEEAERAIRQAEAAAEIAALNARAVAEAQNQLLFELDQLASEAPASTPVLVPSLPTPLPAETAPAASTLTITEASTQTAAPTFTVRLYEDIAHPIVPEPFVAVRLKPEPLDEDEDLALDEEIAFRQSPVFEPTTPPIDIPANLIEFPRQLVAARKARPRLAEGPLREDAANTADQTQLRIFEVEPTQISTAPAVESAAPEWSSIMLGALPAAAPVETPEAPFSPVHPLMTAPLRLRLMAAIFDICIVTAGLLAFIAAFALTATKILERFPAANTSSHMPTQLAAIAALATFAFLYLLYQILFFTFAEATPGMRFARIALCTFSDENPTRVALRRRLFACLLSACPLGIGFLWAFLDDDRLGWHDRISRMYQRSY